MKLQVGDKVKILPSDYLPQYSRLVGFIGTITEIQINEYPYNVQFESCTGNFQFTRGELNKMKSRNLNELVNK